MRKEEVKAGNNVDARGLARFVQSAGKFSSNVSLGVSGRFVNAKSIMGVMSVGVTVGKGVTIQADGADEDEAIVELRHAIAM